MQQTACMHICLTPGCFSSESPSMNNNTPPDYALSSSLVLLSADGRITKRVPLRDDFKICLLVIKSLHGTKSKILCDYWIEMVMVAS